MQKKRYHLTHVEPANGISEGLQRLHSFCLKNKMIKQSYEEYFDWFINQIKQCLKDFIDQQHQHITQDNYYLNIPISHSGISNTFQFTRWELCAIHSTCFFHIEWDPIGNDSIGDISYFDIIFKNKLAKERLICNLAYLHYMFLSPESVKNEIVTFKRNVITTPHDWSNDISPLHSFKYSAGGIQLSKLPVHVDFANKLLHIHQIIPSVTQEELLFSTRPECLVGMLLFEKMKTTDSISIENTLSINTSKGYSTTFEWTGFYCDEECNKHNTIIAIDAVFVNCFGKKKIDRDLNKCYNGFSSVQGDIATGKWGCGVFSNDPCLKFIQQVMVLSSLNRNAEFHWMDEQEYNTYNLLLNKCISKGILVKQIYEIITKYNKTQNNNFFNYLEKVID
ncbi:poly(ADP-ribose) glycohydrolase [Entamoeba marina]